MQSSTLERNYTLRACDADCMGRWRLDALLAVAQETAGMHSAALGYSEETMAARNAAWILSRTRLVMERWPLLGEEITVTTWPAPRSRVYFPRHILLTDAEGKTLGGIHSLWLLFDTEKRTLINPRHFDIHIPTCDRPAPAPEPGKIPVPEQVTHARAVSPLYTDIDINQHVNNTRYAAWISDLYPIGWHRDHVLRDLTIQYVNEVMPGQTVMLDACLEGDALQAAGYDASRENLCFAAAGTWRDILPAEEPPAVGAIRQSVRQEGEDNAR